MGSRKNYVSAETKEMASCSVEKLFIKKRSDLPAEFWENCVEHVEKVEESHTESDKIINLRSVEGLSELG